MQQPLLTSLLQAWLASEQHGWQFGCSMAVMLTRGAACIPSTYVTSALQGFVFWGLIISGIIHNISLVLRVSWLCIFDGMEGLNFSRRRSELSACLSIQGGKLFVCSLPTLCSIIHRTLTAVVASSHLTTLVAEPY